MKSEAVSGVWATIGWGVWTAGRRFVWKHRIRLSFAAADCS